MDGELIMVYEQEEDLEEQMNSSGTSEDEFISPRVNVGSDRWVLALIIIGAGVVLGTFVVLLVTKKRKR